MAASRVSITLAANATNNNVFQGTEVEYNSTSVPQKLVIAASSDVGTTRLGVQLGSRTIAQPSNSLCPLEPGAGQGPRIPDDVVCESVIMPGERMYITLEDGGAGSTTRVAVQTT